MPHKPILRFLLVLLVATDCTQLTAQAVETHENFQRVNDFFARSYGSDNELLNGRKYYLLYSHDSHPFIYSDTYTPGDLLLNGIKYSGVPLNYDLYQQEVILQYRSYSGQPEHLVINQEFLQYFILSGNKFVRKDLPGKGTGYCELICEGSIACFAYWEKEMQRSSSGGFTTFHFTIPSRNMHYAVSGKIYRIKSRSAFVRLFEKEFRKDIRQYLRSERIHPGKSGNRELKGLIEYCTGLIQ